MWCKPLISEFGMIYLVVTLMVRIMTYIVVMYIVNVIYLGGTTTILSYFRVLFQKLAKIVYIFFMSKYLVRIKSFRCHSAVRGCKKYVLYPTCQRWLFLSSGWTKTLLEELLYRKSSLSKIWYNRIFVKTADWLP